MATNSWVQDELARARGTARHFLDISLNCCVNVSNTAVLLLTNTESSCLHLCQKPGFHDVRDIRGYKQDNESIQYEQVVK